MNFLEAVKLLKEGKIIRRSGWENKKYCLMNVKFDNRDFIGYRSCYEGRACAQITLKPHDVLCDDWEVYEEYETEIKIKYLFEMQKEIMDKIDNLSRKLDNLKIYLFEMQKEIMDKIDNLSRKLDNLKMKENIKQRLKNSPYQDGVD